MKLEGVILESKYPEYVWPVKGPMQKVWKDGYMVDEAKLLLLEFDRYMCELDVMAENQEWTDEDREFVSRTLERYLNNKQYVDAWVHESPKPAPPWPTYDATAVAQISVIAEATGTVDAALAYERFGRETRENVLKKLLELQSKNVEASEPIEDDVLSAV